MEGWLDGGWGTPSWENELPLLLKGTPSTMMYPSLLREVGREVFDLNLRSITWFGFGTSHLVMRTLLRRSTTRWYRCSRCLSLAVERRCSQKWMPCSRLLHKSPISTSFLLS